MKPGFDDLLVSVGVILVGLGLWWIDPRAALIGLGVILFLAGLLLARGKS
jgi:hypothetical protein